MVNILLPLLLHIHCIPLPRSLYLLPPKLVQLLVLISQEIPLLRRHLLAQEQLTGGNLLTFGQMMEML